MTNKCAACGHDKKKHHKHGGSVCWGTNQSHPLSRACKCSKYARVVSGKSKDVKVNPNVEW